MEMKNVNDPNEESRSNADPEDQFNNNLNLVDGNPSQKKRFSMKFKRIKNKYFQRSLYSIIFIIVFLSITLVNFYGIDLLVDYLSKTRSQNSVDNEFEIRPRVTNGDLIHVNTKNVEQLFGDIKDYLKEKSPQNCKSNDNYYCFLIN